MTEEAFDKLVRRLEDVSRAAPARYRRRVRAWVMLGYAVPVAAAALCLACVGLLAFLLAGGKGALLALPVLAVLVAAAVAVGASLWMRLPPPVGVGLDRARHAKLFDAVDAIARRLGADPVHYVLLDDSLNAAMAHLPRFGWFGGYRNYLVVGLPLMRALSPAEFNSVVAHEVGHLAGRHGRLGASVYRTHRVWQRWLASTEGRANGVTAVANRFFRWYAPRFAATTFVMRRAEEYEADRAAALVATPPVAAEALVRVGVAARFQADQVSSALSEFKTAREPPEGVYEMVLDALPAAARSPHARRWLRATLADDTEHGDSHPSTAERLAALGALADVEARLDNPDPRRPPLAPVPATAADAYLAGDLPRLIALLDRGWRTSLTPAWRERRRNLDAARATLLSLDNLAAYTRLSEQDQWRRAVLVAELCDPKQAVDDMRAVQRVNPKDPQVNMIAGSTLLECGQADGVAMVEAAMAADLSLVEPGCETIAEYYTAAGRADLAEPYVRRMERHYYAVRSARRERAKVTAADAFRPHGLAGDLVWYLRERVAEVGEVAEAYLVQKVMVNFADRKLLVLGLVPAAGASAKAKRRMVEDLLAKTGSFEHPTVLAVLDEKEQALAWAIGKVAGGCIFRRGR